MAQGGSSSRRSQTHVETKLLEDEGIVLPSSSSKDEDILSESSDDIETIARQTLERIHEDVSFLNQAFDRIKWIKALFWNLNIDLLWFQPAKSFATPSRKIKLSSSDASNYTPESKIKNHDSSEVKVNNDKQDVEAQHNADKIKPTKKQRSQKITKLNEGEEGEDSEGEMCFVFYIFISECLRTT